MRMVEELCRDEERTKNRRARPTASGPFDSSTRVNKRYSLDIKNRFTTIHCSLVGSFRRLAGLPALPPKNTGLFAAQRRIVGADLTQKCGALCRVSPQRRLNAVACMVADWFSRAG